MSNASAGQVQSLWRYPIKSLQGERLERATLGDRGLLGDRAFAILDMQTGNLAGASKHREFPTLLMHRARFVEEPVPGLPFPVVEVTAPDGERVRSDAPDVNEVLSRWLGRTVRLVSVPPPGYLESRARFLGSIGCSDAGETPLQDACPLSVITTSTLESLTAVTPASMFDVRRFRMNVLVEWQETGFPENEWPGREFTIGDAARIRVLVQDPRCAVTTMAFDGLPRDPQILRTVAQANSIPVGPSAPQPCAGVYARVVAPGAVRAGDAVMQALRNDDKVER